MDGLVDDGFIILGGPVGSGGETLHVVEAADEDEIRERLADDPWASAGLLRVDRIEPWLLWLDSRAGTPALRSRVISPRQPYALLDLDYLGWADTPVTVPGRASRALSEDGARPG